MNATVLSSVICKFGSLKLPIFAVSREVPVANVFREPASSKPEPDPFPSRGAKLKRIERSNL